MTKHITPAEMLSLIQPGAIADAQELLNECAQVHAKFLRAWSLLRDKQYWTKLARGTIPPCADRNRDAVIIAVESNLLAMEAFPARIRAKLLQLSTAQSLLAENIKLLQQAPAALLVGDYSLTKAQLRYVAISSISAKLDAVLGRIYIALHPDEERWFDRAQAKKKMLKVYHEGADSAAVFALLDAEAMTFINDVRYQLEDHPALDGDVYSWGERVREVTEVIAAGTAAMDFARSELTDIAVSDGQLRCKIGSVKKIEGAAERIYAEHAAVVLNGAQALMEALRISDGAERSCVRKLRAMCVEAKGEHGDFPRLNDWVRGCILNNLIVGSIALRDYQEMQGKVDGLRAQFKSADWVEKVYAGEVSARLLKPFRLV